METTNQLDPQQVVDVLRRRWVWLLVPVLLGPLAGYFLKSDAAPVYEATAVVLLQRPSVATASAAGSARQSQNEALFATGDELRKAVEDQLGYVPIVRVNGNVSVDTLEFTAKAGQPDLAASDANTWAETYMALKQQSALDAINGTVERLQAQLTTLREQRAEIRQPLDELDDEIADTTEEAALAKLQLRRDRLSDDLSSELAGIDAQQSAIVSTLTQIELDATLGSASYAMTSRAVAPPKPQPESLGKALMPGIIGGLLAGIALALGRERIDQGIRTEEDVIAASGLPVLGLIPKYKLGEIDTALATFLAPDSPIAEAYQKTRASLEFSMVERPTGTILVTSPNPSEGKTTTAVNLAWALAAVGKRVFLADVDFRRPRIATLLELEDGEHPTKGFTALADDGPPADRYSFDVLDDTIDLRVIPTGALPANPANFVASQRCLRALAALAADADLVVLDGPPALPVSDALTLSRHVDVVVLVVRAGKTRRNDLVKAADSLRKAGAGFTGVVLIGAASTHTYGRYEYYDHRARDDDDSGSWWGRRRGRDEIDSDTSALPGRRLTAPTRESIEVVEAPSAAVAHGPKPRRPRRTAGTAAR